MNASKVKATGFMAYVVAARELCGPAHKKLLILYYATNVNKDGAFFKSYTDITRETGLSERTVRRINTEWKKKGLIQYTTAKYGSGKANAYQINLGLLERVSATSRQETTVVDAATRASIKHAERQKRYRERLKNVTANEASLSDSVTAISDAVTVN